MPQLLDTYRRYLECKLQCAKKKGEAQLNQESMPFVTISRQTGAGGLTIARELVQYLNEHDKKTTCPWTLFDRDLAKRVLEEHHLPRDFKTFMPERKTSEIQDVLETFFEVHPPAFELIRYTTETIAHLAKLGHVVLVGRGANVVTRSMPGGLHVRLVGNLENRIKHVSDYFDLDGDLAKKKVTEEDRGRRDYVKQNYQANIDDPLLYDLIINTDHLDYKRVAQILGRLVLSK